MYAKKENEIQPIEFKNLKNFTGNNDNINKQITIIGKNNNYLHSVNRLLIVGKDQFQT